MRSVLLPVLITIVGCTLSQANELETILGKQIEERGAVAGALYVVRDADTAKPEVLAEAATGFANLATSRRLRSDGLFRYASVSKTYIALLVARAHLAGQIGLDDDPLNGTFPQSGEPYLPSELIELIPTASKAT